MIVSWDWLLEYVKPTASAAEVANKLMMTGLNLEGIDEVGDDLAIDLEVTSNRPDCLGHIGVAREISVCFDDELTISPAQPVESAEPVGAATSVSIECEDVCHRYIARVIKGVKVGPSPEWMRNRLATIGIAPINNIVDITNYVLMECGQPLHAFDFDKLAENRIVVRRAKDGETIEAIDHKEYKLTSDMCVIADAEKPVAIGGVMGGATTEISDRTTNVLVEVADFAVKSIRGTARELNLHSDSSFRFERGIDPHQLDWASRRCCELILELAGGELLAGSIWAGEQPPAAPDPVTLRFARTKQVLGVDVPREESLQILAALGMELHGEATGEEASFIAPSWRRRDVSREADLLEEVARIYGYEKIPENAIVPLAVSQKSLRDRVIDRVCEVLTASGYFEAVTMTFTDEKLNGLFTPRMLETTLSVDHSSRRHENVLRQSLIPSLLQARRENERHGSFNAQLFEIASVFLASDPGNPAAEPKVVGMISGCSLVEMKGQLLAMAARVNSASTISVRPSDVAQFVKGRGAEILLNGEFWGWFGELDRSVTDQLGLRDVCVVAEVDLSLLESSANLRPEFVELPRFPASTRDLNFVLDESVTWSQLEEAVTTVAGPNFESISFSGQYRGKQLPAEKKSYLLTISYR
ncbi:MAG: phenylalanine--tRNA ligase subunit beta, partial [Planctomycetota bacterium]|nr:phenylalanine--tRNA ligase subunit beta [Planctomycetota bacterium]